jgi:Rps23 Pro-64 3,4-dihydroxylase Tpa1-like proline 4-hydroxylase
MRSARAACNAGHTLGYAEPAVHAPGILTDGLVCGKRACETPQQYNQKAPITIMLSQETWIDMMVVRLYAEAEAIRAQWADTSVIQTRHFVLDGLIDSPDLTRSMHEAFLRRSERLSVQDSVWQKRKTYAGPADCDPVLVGLANAFSDPKVAAVFSYLLDLDPISAGRGAIGGELIVMGRGDHASPFIDASHSDCGGKIRRLKLFYFTSPDWEESKGGILEIWDSKIATAKAIVPAAGRLVVMETSETSWHSLGTVMANRHLCLLTTSYFSETGGKTRKAYASRFSGLPGEKGRRILGYTGGAIRNLLYRP